MSFQDFHKKYSDSIWFYHSNQIQFHSNCTKFEENLNIKQTYRITSLTWGPKIQMIYILWNFWDSIVDFFLSQSCTAQYCTIAWQIGLLSRKPYDVRTWTSINQILIIPALWSSSLVSSSTSTLIKKKSSYRWHF